MLSMKVLDIINNINVQGIDNLLAMFAYTTAVKTVKPLLARVPHFGSMNEQYSS